jgi:hypothetical protein
MYHPVPTSDQGTAARGIADGRFGSEVSGADVVVVVPAVDVVSATDVVAVVSVPVGVSGAVVEDARVVSGAPTVVDEVSPGAHAPITSPDTNRVMARRRMLQLLVSTEASAMAHQPKATEPIAVALH